MRHSEAIERLREKAEKAWRLDALRDAVVEAARAWDASDTLANNAALRAAVVALVTEERKP